MSPAPVRPVALTIAGFDPSSGAGITADLAVFEAQGCFGISAITALTVQSTTGVRRVQVIEPALLTETLDCLQEDLPPAGVKIGMLANGQIVSVVAGYLRKLRAAKRAVTVVLDPVLVSSSGCVLLNNDSVAMLQDELLPLVDVITPNVDELALLSGLPTGNEHQIRAAMSAVKGNAPNLSVVATGGHRAEPDDLILQHEIFSVLPGRRIQSNATHGTGCAFSSALLCGLLHNNDVVSAAERAKRYVEVAMEHAEPLGKGRGPMRLGWTSHLRERW